MSKIGLFPLLFLCLVIVASNVSAQQMGAPGEQYGKGTVVLRAAQIIDGTGSEPIKNGVVVVTDAKIVAVGT